MSRNARYESEKAKYQALTSFLGQLFGSPKVILEGAPDVGVNDEWMMSNIPPETVLSLEGLMLVAIQDDLPWLKEFISMTLRAFKGINGYANNIGKDIAIAGFGGSKSRMMKRNSFIDRRLRGKPEYEEVDDDEA